MPDLTPDTSIYQHEGLGGMSLPSLMSLVQSSRALQSQQAESDALRASGGDPEAAKQMLMQPGAPGFVNAHTITGLTEAAKSQFGLHQQYMAEAGGAISSLLSRQDNNGNLTATLDDWHRMSHLLAQYHVPQSMLDAVETAASKNRHLDKNSLLDIQAYVTGGQGTPTTPVTTGGVTRQVPNVALQRGNAANPPTSITPPPTAQPNQPGKPQYEDTATTAANTVLQNQPKYPAGTTGATNLDSHYAAGTAMYNAHTAEAGNYSANAKPFDEMINIMRAGGDGTTGRGKEVLNTIKNWMHTLHLKDESGLDDVSNFEQLKKYMVQAVQGGSIGSTDARMFETVMGSPNPNLLTQSNMKLAQVMLGMMRRNTIAKSEFDRTGLGNINPGLYGDWRADWEKRQDTAGFVWDHMTTKDRQAYRAAHPDRDAAVGASWAAARRSGVSPKLDSDQ